MRNAFPDNFMIPPRVGKISLANQGFRRNSGEIGVATQRPPPYVPARPVFTVLAEKE
jgi:hypothetical protein